MRKFAFITALACISAPLAAKDSLGVYSNWAAFRDSETPRCYAIAKPRGNAGGAYASIATWPNQKIRNQMHFRLSRTVPEKGVVKLRIGNASFDLVARGQDAWAKDQRGDAAITAALRSATSMRVSGAGFSDRYDLEGVATAMDAAVVGCAKLR